MRARAKKGPARYYCELATFLFARVCVHCCFLFVDGNLDMGEEKINYTLSLCLWIISSVCRLKSDAEYI